MSVWEFVRNANLPQTDFLGVQMIHGQGNFGKHGFQDPESLSV